MLYTNITLYYGASSIKNRIMLSYGLSLAIAQPINFALMMMMIFSVCYYRMQSVVKQHSTEWQDDR